MLALVGRIKLVALCVNMSAPVKRIIFHIPAVNVPNAVIDTTPDISTKLPVAAAILTVAALAIVAPLVAKFWRRVACICCKSALNVAESVPSGWFDAAVADHVSNVGMFDMSFLSVALSQRYGYITIFRRNL